MIKKYFPLLLTLGLLTACSVERPHLQTLQLNKKGGRALVEQKYSEAQGSFLEALQFDPFKSALHLNLGLSFEGLELAEKAQQSYQEAGRLADQAKDLQVQFLSRYNEAQLLGRAKKVDEALARYQAALEIAPDSNETKHNIELLISSAQGEGQGEGDPKDSKEGDQKNQGGQGQGKDQKDSKDSKDNKQKDPQDGDKKEQKPQEKKSSPKYVPRQFNGKDLSEGDVKKILGELKQQESRIRSDYNKKDGKEQPRAKDW